MVIFDPLDLPCHWRFVWGRSVYDASITYMCIHSGKVDTIELSVSATGAFYFNKFFSVAGSVSWDKSFVIES